MKRLFSIISTRFVIAVSIISIILSAGVIVFAADPVTIKVMRGGYPKEARVFFMEVEKALVKEIKEEWRQLWLERIDDKFRAEGVASRAFPLCFVDRGTVIMATRNFRPLDLKEILTLNKVQNAECIVGPPPAVGGWHKFARTVLNKQSRHRIFDFKKPGRDRVKRLQPKKGGRGWLHCML